MKKINLTGWYKTQKIHPKLRVMINSNNALISTSYIIK